MKKSCETIQKIIFVFVLLVILGNVAYSSYRGGVDYFTLLSCSIVVLVVIGFFCYYSCNLNKLVNQRTEELLKANELLEKSKEHYREMYVKADRAIKQQKEIEEEKKIIEEQLMHAQKMDAIGKLAGGIAHDFNNILAVFFAQIHLVRMDIKKGRPVDGRIDEVETAANRAASLVEQLLLFSKKGSLNLNQNDLNVLIENCLKMIGRILGEDIELSFLPGKLFGLTMADCSQIEQVIINLCINARDAMPNGGKLVISTCSVDLRHLPEDKKLFVEPGRYNLLTISDNGVGIEEEYINRIFEPFFTTKEINKGTGLGLATVYSVVKGHGGFVEVSSKVGEGTTFNIYLPYVEKKKIEKSIEEDVSIVLGRGQTILLAEDDDNLRELVYEFLIEHGYKVILAVDGKKAIELYEHYKDCIDLLLLDVVMPNVSGNEVYEYIRKLGANIPIIFCSGYAFEKFDEINLNKNEIVLVQKPYKIPNLLNLIANTLKI